ncbi:MAG: hypothetical protein Q4D82_05380 [Neisseria sp.]|nr:hypothetical protein [Neisseria sp.]
MLLYSTEFPLNVATGVKDVLALAGEWIDGSRHYRLSQKDFTHLGDGKTAEKTVQQDGEKLESGYVYDEESGFEIGGIRFTHHDGSKDWVTTIVSTREKGVQMLGFQLSCELPNASTWLPKAKKPYFIKQVFERFGGGEDGELVVSDRALYLQAGDEEKAAAWMQNQAGNSLPMVYISFQHGPRPYQLNPNELAKRLAGVAHIVVEPDQAFSIALKNLTDARNVYGGTTGVYWPGSQARKSYYLSESCQDEQQLADNIEQDIVQALANKKQSGRCSWLALKESLSKQRLAQLKQDYADNGELQEYIDAFDKDIKIRDEKLAEADQEIIRLQAEIYRLEAARLSMAEGVLVSGSEQDLYAYEIRSFILEALQNELDKATVADSRKQHILIDLLSANRLDQDFRQEKRQVLQELMRNYTGLSGSTLEGLKKLGFQHSEDGKHHRLVFAGDKRYAVSASKTGSDHRAGKNFVSDVSKKIF